MLLAYLHPYGTKDQRARLCILADKIDELSVPVPIEALPVTTGGVYRLGLYESCTVRKDADGGVVIKPVNPSKLYITPNQVDQPGAVVSRVKVKVLGDGEYEAYFAQDKDAEDVWNVWDPLKKA